MYQLSSVLPADHLKAIMLGYWVYPTGLKIHDPDHLVEYLRQSLEIGPLLPNQVATGSYQQYCQDVTKFLELFGTYTREQVGILSLITHLWGSLGAEIGTLIDEGDLKATVDVMLELGIMLELYKIGYNTGIPALMELSVKLLLSCEVFVALAQSTLVNGNLRIRMIASSVKDRGDLGNEIRQ